jgi:response regulator NasT
MKALRIAVADDEKDMREYLEEVMPRLGHEVVASASTGQQLADRCRTAAPDLVITDIKMPDMDGIEVAATIARQKPTPVILVSAHHDSELLARLGADYILGYLIKPINEGALKAAIGLAMNRFTQLQAVLKESSDLRQAMEERKLIERAKGIIMKRLRVDEEDAFRRLRKVASDHNHRLVDVGRRVITAEEVFHQLDRT